MSTSGCTLEQRVRYAVCSFLDEALSWWNTFIQNVGKTTAYELSWNELKRMLLQEYCPRSEIMKLETEFWNLTMVGSDVRGYTTRFHELARLVPRLVDTEEVKIEHYIRGLAPQIRGMVNSSKPVTSS